MALYAVINGNKPCKGSFIRYVLLKSRLRDDLFREFRLLLPPRVTPTVILLAPTISDPSEHGMMEEDQIQLWRVVDGAHAEIFGRGKLNRFQLFRLSRRLSRTPNLQVLSIVRVNFECESAIRLASCLRDHPALSQVSFSDCEDEDGFLVDALAETLQYNSNITSLDFHGCWTKRTSSIDLGKVLSAAKHILDLRVVFCDVDKELATSIASGLERNQSLKSLDLTGNGIDGDSMEILKEGLLRNGSLTHLKLDFNPIGDRGVAHLADALTVNERLSELHLFRVNITPIGAEALAKALEVNRGLQMLETTYNAIGDRGVAAFARALTVNTTLKRLFSPVNGAGEDGIVEFARRLPEMRGLEGLSLGMLLDDRAVDALIEGLKCNTVLQDLFMEMPIEDADKTEAIDFYLRLNRSGRRLVRDPSVPKGLWPHVLGRASSHISDDGTPDALHYLLQARPDLLCGNGCFGLGESEHTVVY